MRTKLILICLFVLSASLLGERTKLRPGRNVYSPEEDVELGREVAKDAEKQLVLINNSTASAYIVRLGQSLVAKAPNEYKFPFTFKIVDDKSINAFALPGGPVYVNRGAIEAADNEAQIAGVMAHEIGHVVLRHGTNQATKGQLTSALPSILGGILGGGIGQAVGVLGGFAANSVLLRYSRDAESQADLMGTQILYDVGYDPRAMAQFFDKLAKDHKGTKTEQFFSNHPIPENRVIKVNDEIRKLGGLPSNPRTDSADFQDVKKTMLALPEPKAPPKDSSSQAKGKQAAPSPPSARFMDFQASGIQLRHPDNWKPTVQGSNITLAPDRGVFDKGDLAYGMIIDVFQPQGASNINQATSQLLENLRSGNPAMKVVRSSSATRLDGQQALSTELVNDSPAGGQETDVVVTVLRPNGDLLYFIEVAPAKAFAQYRTAFRTIMDSVRLR